MTTRAHGRALILALIATSALVIPGAGAGAATAVTGARTLYVDCSAPQNGPGTAARPMNSLAAANKLTLVPGDALHLRRGTTCTGMLAPAGSGTAAKPILIDDYGSASAAPARIAGGGAPAAIYLFDMSYVTVDGLDLSNSGDAGSPHRGLYFAAKYHVVRGVIARNLVVHDVAGTNSLDGGKAGGGIVGWTLSGAVRFAGVVIENNLVHDVSRQGITIFGTTSTARPPATKAWGAASTGVVVRGNTVNRVQGDGIVVLGAVGTVIGQNIVQRANLAGHDHTDPVTHNCAAGIWAFNTNSTVIEHNEVSFMHYGPSTKPGALNGCDGEAFDVDYNQDGTVVQYNYSHNNDGGFILLCTADGKASQDLHRADVRYNLSVDDNTTFNLATCSRQTNPAVNNLTGVRMYNNTIVAKTPRVTTQLDEDHIAQMRPFLGKFLFDNNIVYATATGANSHTFECGSPCTHNVWFRRTPPSTATNSVTADPRFVNPTRRGSGPTVAPAFDLRSGSPAIAAGVTVPPSPVPSPAQQTFFGAAIPTPPNIGFS